MSKSIRCMIALNALLVVVALLMFVIGCVAAMMANKMEKRLSSSSMVALEAALNKRVGQPYSAEFHEKIVGLLGSSDEAARSGAEVIRSYSVAMFQIASLNFVVGTISLVLSWRTGKRIAWTGSGSANNS